MDGVLFIGSGLLLDGDVVIFFVFSLPSFETSSIPVMTSNRPIEDWGKLLGEDVPAASAILDRFLHHAHAIAITGRSYRLKDKAVAVEPEGKKAKIKSNEPSTAEPAS